MFFNLFFFLPLDKKWRLDKIQNMEHDLDRNSSSSRKSPRGSRRRSDSRGNEQDPGLLITVAGGSEDRSVAEKTDKNIEMMGQHFARNAELDRQSSKEAKEKASSKSKSSQREEDPIRKEDGDHHKSKSRKNRSRSRSKERRKRSRSRERRERSRSKDRRERSRSRERRDRSRSKERYEGSRSREKSKLKEKRERSRSLEFKSKEKQDRSRSREKRERSKSREKKPRSRSRERRKSKQDRSRSIEGKQEKSSERKHDQSRSGDRKQEHSRSTERRRDRSRSLERRRERSLSDEDSRSWSMENLNKKGRGEKRRSRDVNLSPHWQENENRHEKEEKLDVFSYGIKRLHDGKSKKSKKLKTTVTEPIVILSDDEQDPMPKRKSHQSSSRQKDNLEDRISNQIEPIITTRSSLNRHIKDTNITADPPLPLEELIQPPMPPALSNVVRVLTDSREQRNGKVHHKESSRKEEARTKERIGHRHSDDEMEGEYNPECAYDPEFPTVDMEESPTEDQPILLDEAADHVQRNVNPLLHKELPMQSISPLPGPPPPPMPGQGLLGEPSILLPAHAGEPPQSLLSGAGQQIPLQLRMLAPGFHAQQPGGLPPQRQLIVNHPVFMNRPGSFPHIQQLPAGHPLHPRLVSTPGGIVTLQNQFPPRNLSLVSLPGQAGLLNGALDHLPHDPHLILTSDPHGDPRLHHPPHPESHVISLRPEVPVVPMSVAENMPLSIASSEALSMNQPNIIPSVSQLEQISQITKLLNTQAQLAMFGKESKGIEHEHKPDRMEQKSSNVFKVPLPPILTHTLNKVKSDKENLEMVDMDMSSPQDNGNIEIPTSSSEKSERSRRRDKKRSHRHRSEDRHRSTSHEDRVSSTVESQRTFDQIMEDMNNADEIPSSAVELTNKEKVRLSNQYSYCR